MHYAPEQFILSERLYSQRRRGEVSRHVSSYTCRRCRTLFAHVDLRPVIYQVT